MRVKGAELRGLSPSGAELANKLFEAHPSAHTRAIDMCTASLLDFHVLLGVAEWHPQAAAEACRRCCVQCRASSLESTRNGRPLHWKQEPKMHPFQELSEYQSFVLGNPDTFFGTHQDEDCAGIIAGRSLLFVEGQRSPRRLL